MKIKLKVTELHRQLVSGRLPERRPQLAQVLGWALNFAVGLILGTVPLYDKCGPFGIAIAAQAGAQVSGLLCACGASIGYLLVFGFDAGIKYVAAVTLVFTASYVFQELKIYSRIWFMPSIAALFTLLTGILGTFGAARGASMILPIATDTILAGGATYFFREALSTAERDTESAELRHGISVVILFACILMALSDAVIVGVVSLGRFVSLIIVLTAAFKGGAMSGATAGAALGIAMDIAAGGGPFYSMAYAFSGLISGVFSKHNRLVFVLSFILCGAVCVISVSGGAEHISSLYETFAATVIFMVLPASFRNALGAFLRPAQVTAGESGLRKYTARRISKMSEAFKDLYTTVDASLSQDKNDEDLSKIFDRASEVVCSKCKNKSECWNSNYLDTLAAFNDVAPVIKTRGAVAKSDIPSHFMEKCLKPDELVSAINGELRGQMYRRQFRSRLAENRSAAYSQYFDLSEILADVSEELQNAYGPDTLAQRRLSRYLSSIDIDADISVFRDRSGRMHIILESTRLKRLLDEPGYLDKLSGVVGVRLCRPVSSDSGGEGRVMLMEAEPLSVSVGIASMKKKGESVSGDRGTYFKTEQGVLCIVLSDGMGSGEDAARESVAAVRILERFLRSGVDPAVAMKMLNSMMLLKNGEDWGFATVDLMCIDLFTGETAFYKYGAAPSYVRSGKTVRRIRSESLAAGLAACDSSMPDIVKMRLKPGCMALIASDGVLAESDDAWIRKILTAYDGSDTKALARETLQTALKQYGCTDDMTVLAVRVDTRE